MTDRAEQRDSNRSYQKVLLRQAVGREFSVLKLTEPEFIRYFQAMSKIERDEEKILCHFALAYGEVPISDMYEAGELLLRQNKSRITIFDLQVVLAFSLSENQRELANKGIFNHPEFRGVVLEEFYKLFTIS
jgi:hypothetical protein